MHPRCPSPSRPGRWLWAVLSLLSASLPVTAAAQTLELPRPRQGYYLGGGLHFATSHVTESGDGLGVWPGQKLTLRTGEMLTSHLGLGLAAEYGATGRSPDFAAFGGLSLEGQWEFVTNLSLRGSVGFGVVGLLDEDHPDEERRGSYGGAYALGLAYDWFPRPRRLSGGWSLQPLATVSYLPDEPVRTVLFSVGLEVLRWRGLPQNELELPAGEGYEKRKRRGR